MTEGNANDDLFVVSADGLELRRLTETPESEFYPSWSPDGTHLVFYGEAPDNFLTTIHVDGSGYAGVPFNAPPVWLAIDPESANAGC